MKAKIKTYIKNKCKSSEEAFGSLNFGQSLRVCFWKKTNPEKLAVYLLQKEMFMRSKIAYHNAKEMSKEEVEKFFDENKALLDIQLKRLSEKQ